jgi:hypothetical protein
MDKNKLTWQDIQRIETLMLSYNEECLCQQLENMPDKVYYTEILRRFNEGRFV